MCNLYTIKTNIAEIASFFGVKQLPPAPNLLDDVYPGGPGLVIREEAGGRVLEAMTWGFPFRPKGMKPEAKPKAVTTLPTSAAKCGLGSRRSRSGVASYPLRDSPRPKARKGESLGPGSAWRNPFSPGPGFGATRATGARSIAVR